MNRIVTLRRSRGTRGWLRSAFHVASLAAFVSAACVLGVVPVSGAALTGIAELSAGQAHACVRLTSGQARCWGINHFGQIGDGTDEDRGSPVLVDNQLGTGTLSGVARISAGIAHTCAALTSGRAVCWGRNGTGQLGDGTTEDRPRPVTVSNPAGTGPLRNVVAIAAGGDHSCALLSSRQVRCWGANNDGELGDGTNDVRQWPVVVKDPSGTGRLTDVTQIDLGYEHACARLASGQARCWGFDSDGQLGNGGTDSASPLPVAVRQPSGSGRLTGVVRVDVGEFHSCALLASGQARCWGDNSQGQLGDGTTDDRSRPVRVKDPTGTEPLAGVSQVAAGGQNTCAALATRRARCWGDNGQGQLGNGGDEDYVPLPVPVRTDGGGRLSNVAQVGPGDAYGCARIRGGSARCWGDNLYGQLGDGSFNDSPYPVSVID